MAGIVAIVGRPNVGKSTLFNRIVGRRVAITFEEPGITRDRIYRDARWLGKDFIVVDTGGLVPGTDVSIERQIELQVKVAIGEADVVIFVVDGREGLTPIDEDIGQSLRAKGKHYLLAVNKIDTRAAQPLVNEFHKLGTPFPITAEHGTGVAELLDEAVRQLPPVEPEVGEAVRLVILGRPNVGKSSFLNALLGEYRVIVDDRPGTTRDAIETDFALDDRRYRIVDTAGLRKKAKVKAEVEYFSVVRAIANIASSDVAILIVDLTDGPTDQDKKIAALVEEAGKGLVIAGNKSDLIPGKILKNAPAHVRTVLNFVDWAPFIDTSATEKEGIVETVQAATGAFEQTRKRIPDKLLAETVMAEIERRPPPNCRIWSVRQTGVGPPEFLVRVNRPKLDPSYIRFIKHQLRNYFGFQGSPIRITIASRK